MVQLALLILSGWMGSPAQAGEEPFWTCKLGVEDVQVSLVDPASAVPGSLRGPRFAPGAQVEVQVGSSPARKGAVIFEKHGPITKHAAMAWYRIQIEGPAHDQVLELVLMGIDEFDERQKCRWVQS